MLIDRYSFQHSSSSPAAVAAFERAVANLATHRPFTDELDAAMRHDAGLVAGHALRGMAQVLLASASGFQAALRLATASRGALLNAAGGSAGEQALVAAQGLAAAGRLQAAAARLEAHLDINPRDFLAAKLAHALRFMSGQADLMLATTSAILPHWSTGDAGYGHLLGCHAFGLEETGDYGAALRAGRAAVACEPHDVWGLHAVAHVMEMRGQTAAGAAWLEPTRGLWQACGSFGYHLAWHLALFRLAQRDWQGALALYDAHLRPAPTADFRDVANAVSMLWRLEQDGIDAGDRWDSLEEIARARRTDTSYVFGSLHYLLALVAAGDLAAADDVIAALRRSARNDATDQAGVAGRVGLRFAEVVVGMARFGTAPVVARGALGDDLVAVAQRLPDLGGSNAQRDVFLRTLLVMAADTGNRQAVSALATLRLQQRNRDRFLDDIVHRVHAFRSRRDNAYAATAAW